MDNETKSNLKLSGVGSASGGKYGSVEINGVGSVSGDIECEYMNVNGTSEVRGSVKAKEVKTNGAARIGGSLNSEKVTVNGTLSIKGDADSTFIKVSGSIDADGKVHASEIDVKGSIRVRGGCEAESFRSAGGFSIDGLLNADTIYIDVVASCRAKEIGGGKIEIVRSNNIAAHIHRFIKDIFNTREFLVTDIIEGDDIYIESSTVRVIRGNNVKIGPDCEIDLVEYKDSIDISGNAKVKEQRKI